MEHSFRDNYGMDPQQVHEAVEHYRRHYRAHGSEQYRAYPGVESASPW
ncbi:hypothetical protein [Kineococcus sp. SYSU DK006]